MPAAYEVRRCASAGEFLERAGPFLLEREAEHSLLLGLCAIFAQQGAPPDSLFATVEQAGDVCGCLFRTPPEKLVLTRMPLAAVPVAETFVAQTCTSLPAVLGAAAEGGEFAALWAARHGLRVRAAMRQGIHELTRLTPPDHPAPGRLRQAGMADLALVSEWLARFAEDAAHAIEDPVAVARPRLARGAFWLWEDGEPVSLAGRMGRTPHGERIGFVFTPRGHRGRGYASACVAALTAQALAEGLRFCALYTDLANPTSNAIYQRLGYRLIAEVVDHAFEPPA